MGKDIRLTASDSFQFSAYRADPNSAPKGAIVVIQEIFGVNHHIRAVCDRLANEGYVAIAPSIFDRVEPNFTSGYSPDEIATARKFVANPDWAAMLREKTFSAGVLFLLPHSHGSYGRKHVWQF